MAKAPDIDSAGYLVDPAEWTEEIAETFAEKEGITLTDEHWAVIHFMRDYWKEHQVAPAARWTVRFMTETMGADRNRLYELFPYEYAQQACKIRRHDAAQGLEHRPEHQRRQPAKKSSKPLAFDESGATAVVSRELAFPQGTGAG